MSDVARSWARPAFAVSLLLPFAAATRPRSLCGGGDVSPLLPAPVGVRGFGAAECEAFHVKHAASTPRGCSAVASQLEALLVVERKRFNQSLHRRAGLRRFAAATPRCVPYPGALTRRDPPSTGGPAAQSGGDPSPLPRIVDFVPAAKALPQRPELPRPLDSAASAWYNLHRSTKRPDETSRAL